MKKLLSVGVIVLFLGLAIAPSINANISKASIDSELVEITTEVCGINGVTPNTVLLSKEDAEKVEQLFDSIRERLNATETREESEQIFKETVVELDKYGLLGGLSIKQAQRLVTGKYHNSRTINLPEKSFKKRPLNFDENENVFCLIAGDAKNSLSFGTMPIVIASLGLAVLRLISIILIQEFFWVPLAYILLLLTYIFPDLYPFLDYFFNTFLDSFYYITVIPFILLAIVAYLFPLKLLSSVFGFGLVIMHPDYNEFIPAKGWLYSIGLNGIKNWNGSFYGQYSSFFGFPPFVSYYYSGASYFTGINIMGISNEATMNSKFLGVALSVKIGPEKPNL